jgi:hypothetical protein
MRRQPAFVWGTSAMLRTTITSASHLFAATNAPTVPDHHLRHHRLHGCTTAIIHSSLVLPCPVFSLIPLRQGKTEGSVAGVLRIWKGGQEDPWEGRRQSYGQKDVLLRERRRGGSRQPAGRHLGTPGPQRPAGRRPEFIGERCSALSLHCDLVALIRAVLRRVRRRLAPVDFSCVHAVFFGLLPCCVWLCCDVAVLRQPC